MTFRISLFALMLSLCSAAFAAEQGNDVAQPDSNAVMQTVQSTQTPPAAQLYEATPPVQATISDNTPTTSGNLLQFALSQIGVPYRRGGTDPETGFDCSGFVKYVFDEVKGISLPHSSLDLSRIGERIKMAELHPGDLVFFHINRHHSVSHVGIYLGDNRFIHDPNPHSDGVQISTLTGYWAKHFMLARRIDQPDQETEVTPPAPNVSSSASGMSLSTSLE